MQNIQQKNSIDVLLRVFPDFFFNGINKNSELSQVLTKKGLEFVLCNKDYNLIF